MPIEACDLSDSVDVGARTLWGEARGEGRGGMEAVMHVILNRVRLGGWWGATIVEVCLHPWQFSCWNEDDPNRSKLMAINGTDPQFTTALVIAENAVAGKLGTDPTDGADSYYAAGTPVPLWAQGLHPCAEIGHHLFFRTRKTIPVIAIGDADALNQAELNSLNGEST